MALSMTALLAITAPPAARSVGFSGGAAGQMGGFGRGGVGGHAGPANRGGRVGGPGQFDHEGRFDHGGLHGFGDHMHRRFPYPVCFAYAYCPSPALPCVWQGGYWTAQPTFDATGAEIDVPLWVPPGCYY
jgi:hypothetical protein